VPQHNMKTHDRAEVQGVCSEWNCVALSAAEQVVLRFAMQQWCCPPYEAQCYDKKIQ